MKTLYIVRHAKSSWDDFSISDHDRKLLSVGKNRTRKIAGWLKEQHIFPDKIISSSAVRAFDTACLLAEGIGYPKEKIGKERAIYGADSEDVIKMLYTLPDTVEKVMVVGHNPGFTDLVNSFMDAYNQITNFPTSAVAAVSLETESWQEIDLAKHRILFLITPKMVK